MSDHTITWTHDAIGITGEVTCKAAPDAWCRMHCAADLCDEWTPDHEHGLADAGHCQAVEWFEASGADLTKFGPDEGSAHDGAATVSYSDGWRWEYATPTPTALAAIATERDRQDAKWGEQNHPDGTGTASPASWALAEAARQNCDAAAEAGEVTWRHILTEEVYEALAEEDPIRLAEELIQVAAVAVNWHEAITRRTAQKETA